MDQSGNDRKAEVIPDPECIEAKFCVLLAE